MRRDLEVEDDGDGRIIRSWLSEKLPEIPSKGIRRAIQRGQITVDGKRVRSSYILHAGENVLIHIQDKFNIPVQINGLKALFEDQDIAAVFKPAGIEIHGRTGNTFKAAIKQIITPSDHDDALLNPAILHRLDKPTCGILLLAKSRSAIKAISVQFQEHSIVKKYLAIANGPAPDGLTIESDIDGKYARTIIEISKDRTCSLGPQYSVLNVYPTTGRKHQIRKHLSSKGLPIAGDSKYGKQDDRNNQLLLCAESISFIHPNGSELTIACEIPEYFGVLPVDQEYQ